MLCPNCGTNVGDLPRLCDNCAAAREQKQEQAPPQPQAARSSNSSGISHAGFWLRVCASLFDSVLIGVIYIGTLQVLSSVLQFTPGSFLFEALASGLEPGTAIFVLPIIVGFLIAILFQLLFGMLYFSLFESSRLQATPGKLLLGLQVTNIYGERTSLLRAAGRHLAKFLSNLTIGIGYLLAAFTQEKQALHDLLSACFVVKNPRVEAGRRLLGIIVSILTFIVWLAVAPKSDSGLDANFKMIPAQPEISTTDKASVDSPQPTQGYLNLKGNVKGQSFRPNKVIIKQGSIITFSEGQDFFPEKAITLFTFDKGSLAGKTFSADGSDNFGAPHLHVSAKDGEDNIPITEIAMKGYRLDLRFGRRNGNEIPGKIWLESKGKTACELKGDFVAVFQD